MNGATTANQSLLNLYVRGTATVTLGSTLRIASATGSVDVEGGATLAINGFLRIESLNQTA